MNLAVAVLAEKDALVEFTPQLGLVPAVSSASVKPLQRRNLAPAVHFMFHLPIALVQELELHDS
jgi:hypothetical protein